MDIVHFNYKKSKHICGSKKDSTYRNVQISNHSFVVIVKAPPPSPVYNTQVFANPGDASFS